MRCWLGFGGGAVLDSTYPQNHKSMELRYTEWWIQNYFILITWKHMQETNRKGTTDLAANQWMLLTDLQSEYSTVDTISQWTIGLVIFFDEGLETRNSHLLEC